jgi:GT2 family glycosyltransferase
MNRKIGIVILNYNSYENTTNCISSILNYNTKSESLEIYIIDNVSPDKSGNKLLRKYENNNSISVILNSKNTGYAHGNNIGIKAALNDGCEYIFIINSDILFKNNAHKKLADFMDSTPLVGVVAPKVLTKEGKLQSGVIKEPRTFINRMFTSTMLRKIFPDISKKISESSWINKYNFDQPFRCFKVSGCAWMIRRSTFEKIGLLDENTFLYFEEDIYSDLLKENNIPIWVYPKAEVIHLGSDENRYLPAFNYIYSVNSENYFLTKYAKWNWIQLSCILFFRDLRYLTKLYYKDYRYNLKEYCKMRKKTKGYPFGLYWRKYI